MSIYSRAIENYGTRVARFLKSVKDNITVEPVLCFYFVPSVLSLLCAQNVYLDKACRNNLNYSDEICDSLIARNILNYTREETEVQEVVASALSWKSAIQTVIPCIFVIFAGAWSDVHGKRKIFIILPVIGELAAYSCFATVAYFFEDVSVEVLALFESIPQAMSGGWFVMLMGIFSYISDITTTENRTFRIGVVNAFMSLGVPFGTSLSGVLLHYMGSHLSFLVSIIMYSLSLLYGLFALHDVPKRKNEATTSTKLNVFTSFFDCKSLKDTFLVAINKGSVERRIAIGLILLMVVIIFGPSQGELSVQYLYMRYKFGWNEVSYSLFSTYSMTLFFIGNTLALGLFSSKWKFEDATIGIISSTSTIASAFVYVYAASTLAIYFAPVLDIFNGTSYIALRSIASKTVPTEDRGKLNSLFGVAESVTPVIFSPLYLRIYMATLTTFPGAVFFISAGLALLSVFAFTWMYLQRNAEKPTDEEE